MIGESMMKIIPDDLKAEELEILERLKKGERIEHFETQRLNKDGKLLDVFMTISPIKNSADEITGISNMARDITEQKKAEEKINQLNKEIEKSEKKFRGLIENSFDMVGIVNEKGDILYRSPSATRITGWSDDEIKKINRIELMHPDDVGAFTQTMLQVLANPGKPFPLKFRSKHKDGHYIWIEGTSTNMLHDESINGLVANFRDITQSKEAEEKLIRSEKIYRTIASCIPGSVIVLMDRDYRYILVEGDMLEKFGYAKEELMGKTAEEVLPEERYEKILPLFKRVFEGEIFSDEINRAGYDIIRRFVPLKDENNFVYAAMIVSIDVTELKDAQQQIIELNRDLEEKIIERTEELRKTNEELESFSYSVSHDLRSPLRAVSGFAKILEDEYYNVLDDEGKRLLTVVRENAKKMGLLIDDLLSFSRLGRREIHKAAVNMKKLTENIVEEFKSSLNGKLEIKVDDLHSAMADSALINQAVTNLVSNAVKYSSQKEKSVIEITSEKQNGEIIFSVSDNGIGFDMQYVSKLFGVFQRLHAEEEYEGTGVGLAIVHRIITRHGGRVWAKGKPGEGATFYFSLPDYETNKN
jgi:PAS domain S-box-containing protein